MTSLQKTTEVLRDIMNNICGWLTLTMETEDMFQGVLPTLDLEIWVTCNNEVLFQYYEKSMVPITVLHKRSAMPENTRRATLNQELIRRMVNTSEKVSMDKRLEIVDNYAQKMINSEYSLDLTRQTIVGGLKGYERLLSLSKDLGHPKWKPLHLAAKWNPRNRRIAKQLAKTNWYKEKSEVEPPNPSRQEDRCAKFSIHKDGLGPEEKTEHVQDNNEKQSEQEMFQKDGEAVQGDGKTKQNLKTKKRGPNRRTVTLGGLKKIEKAKKRKERQRVSRKLGQVGVQGGWKNKKAGKIPPTRSVIFLDNTGGELARRFQAAEEEAGRVTGYRIRVTESAGTPLSLVLPSTNPWGPQDCGRDDCVLCQQPNEKRINCRKRNILYESECLLCKEDKKVVKAGKDMERVQMDGKGVYVGESSRSLYERAKEHVADRINNREESHQVKHWISSHEDLKSPPKFEFKIVSSFKDPLTRQLSEAIRIERRGDSILNSKAEFNRCRIPRLVIDLEAWKSKKQELDPASREGETMSSQQEEEDPLVTQAEDSLMERENVKRKQDVPEGRKPKRRKFDLLEDWGESSSQEGEEDTASASQARRDWLEEVDAGKTTAEEEKKSQTKISSWLGREEEEIIPDVKVKETPVRRRGKLTKKETKEMKMSHKSIKELFAHQPSDAKRAATIDEKLEKKERLMIKILDWKDKKRKKEADMITVEAEGMNKCKMTNREGDKIEELEQD